MASRYPMLGGGQAYRPRRPRSTYDDIVRQEIADQAYANTLDDSIDPASARRASTLGRELGVPPSAALADPRGLEREAEASRARTLLDYAPELAPFLANPAFAAKTKDDLPSLVDLDEAIGPSNRDLTRRRDIAPRSNLLKAFGVDTSKLGRYEFGPMPQYQPQRGVQETKEQKRDKQTVTRSGLEGLVTTFVNTFGNAVVGGEEFVADALGLGDELRGTQYFKRQQREQEALEDVAAYGADRMEKALGRPGRWIYGAGQSLSMLGAAVMTGAPLATFGATTFGESYSRFRARGAGFGEATGSAALMGGIEVATEYLPTAYLLGQFGKEAAQRFIGGMLLREVPTELAATAGQNLVDALTTGGGGLDEYKENIGSDLLDTAMSTILMTGALGGGSALATRFRREERDQQNTFEALENARTLDRIMTAAEASKTRAEDPDTFREFVEERTADTPVRNLYVPVEAVVEYMQSEAYEPGTLDRYQEQIAEAQATQGDVVIPVADAAAYLAGTQAWEALREATRLSPGGLSLKEANEKKDEILAQLEQRGAEIAAEAQEVAPQNEATTQVYTEVLNRLRSIGMAEKEADAAAQLWAAHYEARAARRGGTALEQFQSANVEFARDGVVTGQRALGQEEGADLDSVRQLAEAEGAELVVEELGDTDIALQWIKRAPRKKGSGRKVMEALLAHAQATGKTVTLGITNNKGAKKLQQYYEELGFERNDPTEDYDRLMTWYPEEAEDRQLLQEDNTPLVGLPATIKVDGVPRTFGPLARAREAARRYMLKNGFPYNPPKTYARVDVERATRIAQAFDAMEHRPDDPEVKRAYRAMIDETVAQYRAIEETGLKVEFITGEDPYGNPRNAILDVVENNHLWVYPTDAGFGGPSSQDVDISGNPLLEIVPGIKISGRPVRANDLFRIVHDYFGHIKEGVGFRADGEENAWRIHSSMYSPLARRAMTTETRGQNSWVNYGPYGEQNRTAGPGDTEYAPQKIGLLPDWVVTEGAGDPAPVRSLNQQDVFHSAEGGADADPVGLRRLAFHGTPFEFERFIGGAGKGAVWFSEGPALAKMYANPRRFRKAGEGRVINALLDIQAPLDVDAALVKLPPHGVVEDSVAWASESFGFDLKAHGWQRFGQDYAHAIFRSPAFADAARAAGYDALKVTEQGQVTWGMLNEGTVVESDSGRELFQSDEAIFYSAAEKVVSEAKQTKATAAQWKALLTPGKTPGIKAEEIEWSGIHDWLDMQEGPIEKGVLLQVLQDRGIKVEEVVLGSTVGLDEELDDATDRYMEELADAREWDSDEQRQDWINEHWGRFHDKLEDEARKERNTQFQSWSSDPSNQTYRELLITLPIGQGGNPGRAPSTHWDTESVVAHTRFMEKTDAEGKRVLFIEEVQSDWHQKGRDQGYEKALSETQRQAIITRFHAASQRQKDARAALSAALPEDYDISRLLHGYHPTGGSNELLRVTALLSEEAFAAAEEMLAANLEMTEAAQDATNLNEGRGIPEAPFKTSWPALVMKRVIRWAVDNGYDRVAWTTGKEQSERYNLGSTVGKVTAFGEGDTVVFNVDRREAFNVIANMEGVSSQGGVLVAPRSKMREIFGADLGEKMAALPDDPNITVFDGSDLNVGGEGMRAFYDRNLVNITNDIIKKYGAKVGPVEFQGRTYETRKGLVQNPGFDITDKLREAARSGFSLFQGPRGRITFKSDGSSVIQLFATADRSTFMHESFHLWLEELKADATARDADDASKAMWQAVQQWFTEQGTPVVNGVIPDDAHEFFARGGERYLMEGKAPSPQLRSVFQSFKAWLMRIYEVVQNLRSPITPEVREVFDRLLATDEAIADARRMNATDPLFKTAEEAGMTEAEFADYQQRVNDARDEAYDALLFRTMEAIRRREGAKQRQRRASVRADVTAQVNSQPQFILLHLLRTGRWLGDPEREYQDVKLNTGWLIDNYGEDVLDKLPKGLPIFKGDGVDGDTVAEIVGMASGTEVVQTLLGMRAASDALRANGETRSMRDVLISEEVDRVMAERYGDVLTDGSIEEEAIAAINTARQGEIIAAEARQLAKRKTGLGTPTPYQFAREWARRTVQGGHVRDVASRAALQRYTRAANKSARAAEAAILAGNIDEAYRQKQAQLLNHALVAESKAAADNVEKIVDRMKRYAARAAMKSVDPDYLDKVHMLLENYDFRPRSQRSIDEQEGFQRWAEAQRALGYEVHIPPRLENRGAPYTRVTVGELEQLNDLVQSLIALGKTKQRLKTAREEREYNSWRDEVEANLRALPDRKLPEKPINEEARLGASAAAELLKVEQIVEEIDDGPTGPMHDVLIAGSTAAENKRAELRERVLTPIAQLYHKLGRKHWRRLQEKVTIQELTWNTLNEGDPRRGQPVTITRQELLAIFMNMGNLSNLEKLSKGERWPIPTLKAVMLRELRKEDFDFAQKVWDQVGLLWPDIVAVEREMSGIVPEQVTPAPIETPYGTYAGGYWPVVYDAARWQKAEDLEGQLVEDMFGIKSGVATQKGHTISRTEAFGPINLSLENVLFQHVEKVVTRIAFAPFARDVLRILRDQRLRGLIDTKLGPEYRKKIEPWLGRQIHEGMTHPQAARWWNKLLRQFRINMTIASMGFRISTGVAQTLGLTASVQRIGARWVGRGMREMVKNPAAAARFIADRSPEMVHRMDAVNREVAEVSAKMRGKHSWFTSVQHFAMMHIGLIDRYIVSSPTWLGAYYKATEEMKLDEAQAIEFADKSVRLSQGSGREKDLAEIQSPNSEAMRFFVMFYTPFNVMFNQQWMAFRKAKRGDPRPMMAVTFWWLIASTLGDALLSGDWPEDPEEPIDWGAWFGRNVFFGLFAGIPIARDITNYTERKMIGEYASSPSSTPVTRVGESIDKAWTMGDKWLTEGEAPSRPIKQVGDVAAPILGLPVSQPGSTAQFLWEVNTGEAQPDSVSDWYFGITRGKRPEEEGKQ